MLSGVLENLLQPNVYPFFADRLSPVQAYHILWRTPIDQPLRPAFKNIASVCMFTQVCEYGGQRWMSDIFTDSLP